MAQGVFCFVALQQWNSGNESTLGEGLCPRNAVFFVVLLCRGIAMSWASAEELQQQISREDLETWKMCCPEQHFAVTQYAWL